LRKCVRLLFIGAMEHGRYSGVGLKSEEGHSVSKETGALVSKTARWPNHEAGVLNQSCTRPRGCLRETS